MKNTMKIKVFFLTIMLAIGALAEVKVSATCSRKAISMDESLRYTVTVENAKNASPPQLGEMDGFRVIMGPSQSSNISIVNGVQSSSQEFSYELQAVKTGKLTIGEAKIKADGKTYNLPKITIDVSEARKSSANSPATTETGGELFLELDASTTNTFVGEQIFLTITLYYKDLNLSGANQPELQFAGFNAQDIGNYQQ
ncbi:BatD family protein, partial [bacterium]|nr:BatD family protein [bacterium]